MDWLQFIAALVSALAWPATLLALVMLLRRPIIELIPALRRLKLKEFELEFREKVADPKPSTLKGVQFANEKIDDEKISLLKPVTYYRDLAQVSPRAALMEVWMEVEAAVADVFYKNIPSGEKLGVPTTAMLDFLKANNLISAHDFTRAFNLRSIRNAAAHQIDISEISPDLITSYIDSAVEIARNLRIKLP